MDEGEDVWTGIRREVSEETNMRVLRMKVFAVIENGLPNGDTWKHAWAVCIVEPKGPFVADPGGEISEIQEVSPEEWLAFPERIVTEIRKRIFDRAMGVRASLH